MQKEGDQGHAGGLELGWAMAAILTSGVSDSLTFPFIREGIGEDQRGFRGSSSREPASHPFAEGEVMLAG